MECPEWLGRLIDRYAKNVDNRTDYTSGNYQSYFYYSDEYFDRPKKDIIFVESRARAEEIINAKKFKKIKKEIDDNDMDVDIEEMPSKIRELEKQIEELKNLPPVEVEQIQYTVDPISDTWDWKNAKIKKK